MRFCGEHAIIIEAQRGPDSALPEKTACDRPRRGEGAVYAEKECPKYQRTYYLRGLEASKGSFYHYFDGKDALLGTLANVFDEKYEELMDTMDPAFDAMEKLVYLNHELFAMIDGGVSMDLLARLLSTQLLARGEKHLLDRNRIYFKLLRTIIRQGQEDGQLRRDRTVNDIVKAYALWERALLYDWCLCGGEYSLVAYTDNVTPMFLESYRSGFEKT